MIMDGGRDGSGTSGVFKKPGIPPSLQRRARSPSARAGLNFPVGKMQRSLNTRAPPGIYCSIVSAVYFSAVLEYLTAEVVTMGGDLAREYGQRRITARHIQYAIRGDADLDRMVREILESKGRYISSDSDDDDFGYPDPDSPDFGTEQDERHGGYSH